MKKNFLDGKWWEIFDFYEKILELKTFLIKMVRHDDSKN